MEKNKTRFGNSDELQRWVKQILAGNPDSIHKMSPEHIHRVIKELNAYQTKLESSRDRFFNLFDHAPIGYFTFDKDGNILEVNHTSAELIGLEKNHLIDKNLSHFIDPAFREIFHSHCQKVIETHSRQICELKLDKEDGALVWVQLESAPLDYGDERTGQFRTVLTDITERKRAEKELSESEKRFKMHFNNAPLGCQSLDESGYLLNVNQAWLDTLGYSRDEVINRHFSEFLAPDFNENSKTIFPELKEAGEIKSVELEMIQKNGSHIIASFNGKILYDSKGRFLYTNCIFQDITEPKQAEATLRESEEKYRTLFEMASDAILTITLPEGKILDVNLAATNMLGYSKDELKMLNGFDIIAPELVDEISHAWQTQVEEKGHFLIETIWLRKDEARIHVAISGKPLEVAGKSQFQLIVRDISEHKLMEDTLKESEERFRMIAEFSPDCIYWKAPNGDILYISPDCERISGYKPEEFQASSELLNDIIHPEDRHLWDNHDHPIQADGSPIPLEFRIITKNGKIRWINHLCLTIHDDDRNFLGVRGVHRDITEQKRAEKKLQFLSSITQQVSDALIATDTDFKIIHINKAAEQLYGYAPDELIGKSPDLLNAEPMSEEIQKEIYQTVVSGKVWVGSHLNRKKDGSIFICEFKISPLRDNDGQSYSYISLQRDITKRRQAAEAVRNSEERYRLLADNITDIIWIAEPDFKIAYMSPSTEKLIGYSVEEISSMNWERLMTLSSVNLSKKIIIEEKDLGVKNTMNGLSTFRSAETELLCKDGTSVWVESQMTFLRDQNGRLIRTIGVTRNITERKWAERQQEKIIEELQEATAKIKTLSGFIPICSSCKKIRDDEGYWKQLEAYISDHSTAEFTHALCPECARRLYPELYPDDDSSPVK